jgi:Bacterial pre-peptidase C-terminal domain/Fibronectin type III domain
MKQFGWMLALTITTVIVSCTKEISPNDQPVNSNELQTEIVTQSTGTTETCGAPGGVSTTNITATASLAMWDAVSGASSYNVEYKALSWSYWVTIANATTSLQWSLMGMEPSTTYQWRVSANCTYGTSSYTETQFTTLANGSCAAPGGLSASNITSTTATVNWNAVSGALVYSVQYKPTSSANWIVATSGTYGLSANLYSLSPNTTYDWRVYTNCSLTEASGYANSQFSTSGSSTPVISACPGPNDVSTNDYMNGAAAINLNTDVKGTIAPIYDIDFYKFTINSYGSINVWLTTLPANYDLVVFNSSGTQIGISKNKGSKNESISLIVDAGTYYAKVYPVGHANSGSCYTLRVQTISAT